MSDEWLPDSAGVLQLPSGRRIRGRALRNPLPPGPRPTFALYLLGRCPPATEWQSRWVRWPDFWLPLDCAETERRLCEALDRTANERVEIGCSGGKGRTGTALALLAVLDGIPPEDAVSYVRKHYDPHAVETPWQRRFVAHFKPTRVLT